MSDTPESQESLDRRGENRAASQWVRTALTEQACKMDTLTDKVDLLHDTLTKSMPNGDIKVHHDTHAMLARREEVSKERKKFWRGFWDDIMKKGLTAAVVGLFFVFVAGGHTKVKELILDVVSTSPASPASPADPTTPAGVKK